MKIDINCDMGEGIGNEPELIQFITSANIACGYHAGDVNTMKSVMELCMQHKVSIGAHVSFLDKENFGRVEITIPPNEIYDLVIQQLIIFYEIAGVINARVNHVKPHGALYNMSAKDLSIATVIARAVKDFDAGLAILGLSESYSVIASRSAGLKTISEGFADRTYTDEGTLTPRSSPGSMFTNVTDVIEQVIRLVKTQTAISTSGKLIPVPAQSVCIHGDGQNAILFARSIHEQLTENEIVPEAF